MRTSPELRHQIGELQARIAGLALHRRLATERLARRASPLTVEQVAQELLDALHHDNLSRDSRERQVLLRDLVVEIEDRHEHWPK